MAIAMPASSPSFQVSRVEPRVSPYMTTTTAHADMPTMANALTRRPVSRWSGVASIFTAASDFPIFPNSVETPTATTSAIPCPAVTRVPENTDGRSSPPGRSMAVAFSDATLFTGTDSPVRIDSSTAMLMPRRSMASAGTRSPSESTMRSPRTTSRPGILRLAPSLMTSARGLERSRSASSACSVRRSWTIVMAITTTTKPISIRASVSSPMNRYSIPAATSIRNIGSRTTSRMVRIRLPDLDAGSSLKPSPRSRATASASEMPTSPRTSIDVSRAPLASTDDLFEPPNSSNMTASERPACRPGDKGAAIDHGTTVRLEDRAAVPCPTKSGWSL